MREAGCLRADATLLERVAGAGRTWAMTHYSPKAVAQRLLDMVGLSAGNPVDVSRSRVDEACLKS